MYGIPHTHARARIGWECLLCYWLYYNNNFIPILGKHVFHTLHKDFLWWLSLLINIFYDSFDAFRTQVRVRVRVMESYVRDYGKQARARVGAGLIRSFKPDFLPYESGRERLSFNPLRACVCVLECMDFYFNLPSMNG